MNVNLYFILEVVNRLFIRLILPTEHSGAWSESQDTKPAEMSSEKLLLSYRSKEIGSAQSQTSQGWMTGQDRGCLRNIRHHCRWTVYCLWMAKRRSRKVDFQVLS